MLNLLLISWLMVQAPRPPGFVRGAVTENTAAYFTIQTASGEAYRYRADGKTWIERDHSRIRAASLQLGEVIEVVSDRDAEPVRYARMVQVLPPVVPKRLAVSEGGLYRLKPAPARPVMTFTGLVVARDGERITLRTRFDGDKIIYLEPDTECVQDGIVVSAAALRALTRVSVVATQTAAGDLEANQVVWGQVRQ